MKLTEYEKACCVDVCYNYLLEIRYNCSFGMFTELFHRYNTMLNIFGFSNDLIIIYHPDAELLIQYAIEHSANEEMFSLVGG